MKAAAAILAVLGGLLLVGGVVGDWVVRDAPRQIGDLTVREVVQTSGTQFAVAAIPAGVLAMLCGPLLAFGRARVIGGVLAAILGLGGGAIVAAGTIEAVQATGALAQGPAVAATGALGVLAAGLLALRRSANSPQASRYTVEGVEDREWELAAEEDSRQ
ncbi:MAG: hypothetical protein ACRDZO_14210 [Egibacteraceae bacterium]